MSNPSDIALGRHFILQSLIAQGGMGQVWRARHVAHNTPVAIKLLTSEHAKKDLFLRSFQDEVRAVARLDHPGIICVYDHGIVGADDASRCSQLSEGAPFLVSELLPEGSLDHHPGPRNWTQLKRLLTGLLHALAHAHARGIIHRDLKPGNVLLRRIEDRLHPVLSDFGIARVGHTPRPQLPNNTSVGTPHYMAPEQITGRSRDQGPWTDLYALGCLCFRLVNGAPPFRGDISSVLDAHLRKPIPQLQPRFDVPRGLEIWLARLLAKQHTLRYQRAADATFGLQRFDTGQSILAVTPSQPEPDLPRDTQATVPTLIVRNPTAPSADRDVLHPPLELPPFPESWRSSYPSSGARRLFGAGLALYGLRSLPLIGRDHERDALWRTLDAVHSEQRPRAVILRGQAGTGKSHLARWLTQHAEELGAAIALVATHNPILGPDDGVPSMLRRHLAVEGLEHSTTYARVYAHLRFLGCEAERTETLAHALCSVLEHQRSPQQSGRWLTSMRSGQQHATLTTYFALAARQRPLILWLDDAQWGLDALLLARALIASRVPAMVLITVRDEALQERPFEAEEISALGTQPHVDTLTVGTLPEEAHAQLVDELLGFSSDAARTIIERTQGHPLFAVQLVGDWVRRGLLELSGDGFRLRAGATVEVPDNIHNLWQQRIERLLSEHPDDTRDNIVSALELAAALGQSIDEAEWFTAALHLGSSIPPSLDADLASTGLAHPTRHGWAFAHGMLRESLERDARQAQRWSTYHRICARMLATLYGDDAEPERLGLHLLEAGDYAAAFEPVLRGATARRYAGDYAQAHQLYGHAQAILSLLGLPHDAPQRITLGLNLAHAHAMQGKLDAASAQLARLEPLVTVHSDPESRGSLLWLSAVIMHKRGDFAGARDRFDQVRSFAREMGDEALEAQALHGLGEVSKTRGELEHAIACYEKARVTLHALGDDLALGPCLNGLSDAYWRIGQSDKVVPLLEESAACFERAGHRMGRAITVNVQGDFARQQGDLESAERAYRTARQLLSILAPADVGIIDINLGAVHLQRQHYAKARRAFENALSSLSHHKRTAFAAIARIALLTTTAQRGAWSAFDEHFDVGAPVLQEQGLYDADIAQFLETAGTLALEQGKTQRAQRALNAARDQWKTLNNTEALNRIDALLSL